jgi:hypothetical protein
MMRETTERTAFAPTTAGAVPPKLRLEFEKVPEAEPSGDLDRFAKAHTLIEESARSPSPAPSPPPAGLATDIPYFDPPALRELAARARGFAEMLSPAYRRIMLEKARRLEREAAQQDADSRP